MRVLPVLVLLVALTLAPLALAQGHAHGQGEGLAVVLHDGPDSGRAVVGGSTHFGFALLKDGVPIVHRDAAFRVEQAGSVLFETAFAHEYDGLFSFDVTFTRPGPYRVVAESEGLSSMAFEGEAVPAANATQATVAWSPDPDGAAPNVVAGTLSILGPDGALLPHTDALVEFRRASDRQLAARVHAHIHDAPIRFAQALDAPGEYVMQVTGYNAFPTGNRPDFHAVVAEFPASVGPATPAGPPVLPAEPPAPLEPLGASASADGLTLVATYDPQNQVGAGQTMRLAGIVVNESGLPVPHVDFHFVVQGPTGLVFESETLHEYDGVFEYLHVPLAPGSYEATLTATYGDATLAVPHRYQVLPPAVPVGGAGVGVVTVQGLEQAVAGEPTELTFYVGGPQGPIQHSEVDVTIAHDGEAPVYRFKLHTHGSGDSKAVVVFPHAGDWTLTVDPLPTLPQPVAFQGPDGPGKPIAFAATVAEGLVEKVAPLGEPPAGGQAVPAGGAATALAAAVVALALLRRRAP